jgi:hypothetical protein
MEENMNFVEFLTTLENTLNEVSVCGKNNVDKLSACFIAIEEMRNSIIQMAQKHKEEALTDTPTGNGGETDG